MRKTLYRVNLILSNGQTLPITVAAAGKERIGPLVEKNRMLYDRGEYRVERFTIADTKYTINMPDEDYERELMFCDIVDEAD